MMTMVVTEVMDAVGCSWPGAHIDSKEMAALTIGANRLAGIENFGLPFCMTVEAEAMGAQVDLGHKECEPRVTRYTMDAMTDIDRLTSVDVTGGRVRVSVDALCILKEQSGEVPIIASLTGPVSLATSLVDPLLYYRALRLNKEAVHNLNRLAMENAIAFGDALVEAGADVMCIADPSATGDLIGPAAFEEFVLPCINEMTEHFRGRYGKPSIVHICGDAKRLGDVLQGLSAEVVSVDSVVGIQHLRSMVPGKVTMGNISTHALERGEPAKLAKAAEQCLRHGVDILAPACGISPKTPMKNILAVAEAALKRPKAA
jgi:[methyl-Co(III) methanol-specific corrinoid protein]:coenzyme M methyltransferase